MFFPTFSIDDGHPLDLKIAEALARKKYKAIFYLPIKNSEGLPTLNKKQILFLSKHFEIGSHTYHHVVDGEGGAGRYHRERNYFFLPTPG